MSRLIISFLLVLNIAFLPLSAKAKKTVKRYNDGAHTVYDLSQDDHSLNLAPLVKRRKNNQVNFFKIQFIGLDDDVVKTKLIDPGIVENQSLKFSNSFEKVQESSVSHRLKLGRNITSSIAYLNLETYIETAGSLELKESIPVRLNIAPVINGTGCIAVVECGHYVFPDLDFYDYVGYVCSPGGAVDEYVHMSYCDENYPVLP